MASNIFKVNKKTQEQRLCIVDLEQENASRDGKSVKIMHISFI